VLTATSGEVDMNRCGMLEKTPASNGKVLETNACTTTGYYGNCDRTSGSHCSDHALNKANAGRRGDPLPKPGGKAGPTAGISRGG